MKNKRLKHSFLLLLLTASAATVISTFFLRKPEVLTDDTPIVSATRIIGRAPTISGTPTTVISEFNFYHFTPTYEGEGDLSFSIINKPSWALFNTTTGVLTGIITYDHAGLYRDIRISVSNGKSNANLPAFNITIKETNRAPEAHTQNISYSVAAVAQAITLSGADADSDDISYTVISRPDNGSLSGTAPKLTYTSNQGYSGADSFTFKTNDGNLDSKTATVSINDQKSTGQSPVVDAPAEKTHIEEAPVEKITEEEIPVEEVPVEEILEKETPVEEIPEEETLVETTPVEETSTEEPPIEKSADEKKPLSTAIEPHDYACESTIDLSINLSDCWYVGAGLGVSQIEPTTSKSGWSIADNTDEGYKIQVGYRFLTDWFTEFTYTELGRADLTHLNIAEIEDESISYKIPELSLGYYFFKPKEKDWDIYVKAGIAHAIVESNAPFSASDPFMLSLSVGAEHQINERWFARAEFNQYSEDARYLGLSIFRHFGNKSSSSVGSKLDPERKANVNFLEVPIPKPIPDSNIDSEIKSKREPEPELAPAIEFVFKEEQLPEPDQQEEQEPSPELMTVIEPELITVIEPEFTTEEEPTPTPELTTEPELAFKEEHLTETDLTEELKLISEQEPSPELMTVVEPEFITENEPSPNPELITKPVLTFKEGQLTEPNLKEEPTHKPEQGLNPELMTVIEPSSTPEYVTEPPLLVEPVLTSEQELKPELITVVEPSPTPKLIPEPEPEPIEEPTLISEEVFNSQLITVVEPHSRPESATKTETKVKPKLAPEIKPTIEAETDTPEVNVSESRNDDCLNLSTEEISGLPCTVFDGKLGIVQFIFGSAELSEGSKHMLNELTTELLHFKQTKIELQGHTDDRGDKNKNMKLSENRAQIVKDYIVARGISAARLIVRGYGESKPTVSNETPEGRATNRRVVFKVL